ncbi:hypothetical protein QAD02_023994 [Eretmocerus hayati]|uniref:Uncharacterized protein n=1 Tax=Eretmocerus hayati TaxID=131215 RepID=A0ACC2PY51_9HYME|nr:hypothetical protein QAD02_023994 [Eretmocerus hayati]
MPKDQVSREDLLLQAVRSCDTDEICRLLRDGADINSNNNRENITPLQAAVETSFKEMIELLLNRGADAKVLDEDGRSILYTWSKTAFMGDSKEATYSEILELLLLCGARVADKDLESEEFNPLASILQYGDVNAAKLVLDDLKKHKDSVHSILHYAASNSSRPATLEFLLNSKQFDVHETNCSGSTALHVAADWDHPEAIATLLEHGANPNTKNHDGESPLLITIRDGRPWSTELLLSYGADLNVRTCDNETLLEFAAQRDISPFSHCQSLIKQIVLLQSQGSHVDPEYYSQIQRSSSFQKYFHGCKKEIELTRETLVDKSVTYYQILTDQDADLWSKNKNVLDALQSKSFADSFRIYGETICMHYVKVRPDQKKLFHLFEERRLNKLS